jgi:hypothetical protein
MGEQAVTQAVESLGGTPVVLAAVIIVGGNLAALLWIVRAFLGYITNRNGRMETALQLIAEQQSRNLQVQVRIAERLGDIDDTRIADRLSRLERVIEAHGVPVNHQKRTDLPQASDVG